VLSQVLSTGLAFFLVWLFVAAAVHKLRAGPYYQDLLSSYFDTVEIGVAGVRLLAVAELAIAFLLLAPQTRNAGLAASALILLFYALMMALQIKRGRDDIACGCAGPASMLTVSPVLVARNVVCAGLAIFALAGAVALPLGISAYGLAAGIAGFMIVLYISSDQLIANAQMMAGDF